MTPDHADGPVLVIGAGVGGLSAAIILAKLGYEVTVLEQNAAPGGMMRSYVRQGVDCNVGVHYLGALDSGQVLRRCFDVLGVSERIQLERMGVDGAVDRYFFSPNILAPETYFDLPGSLRAYKENLHRTFPDQGAQIEAFMGLLNDNAERLDRLDFLFASMPTDALIEASAPLTETLDRLGCSPALKAVLSVPAVWIGVPPESCPMFYHAMTLASYLFSAWRLAENGAQMTAAFVAALAALGGRVRCRRTVSRIRIEDGLVRGVTLDSGEQLDGRTVVSTTHPVNLIEMVPDACLKPSFRRRIAKLENTAGMVAVHARVAGSGIDHNTFAIDVDTSGRLNDLIYAQLRPDPNGGQVLTLLTSAHAERWAPWRDTLTGRRGAAYEDRKRALAHALIERIAPYTGRLDPLKLIDVYTPLSIRDWVASPNGSAYGIMRSTRQMLSAALLNRTSVKGLYLAGQSVLAPGVLGTILGSFTTAKFIVGRERFDAALKKELVQ